MFLRLRIELATVDSCNVGMMDDTMKNNFELRASSFVRADEPGKIEKVREDGVDT